MSTPNDLVELLLDRDKARASLPHLHEQIVAKRQELQRLEDVYDALRKLAGMTPVPESGPREGSISETVIRVLEEQRRPMHAKEVLFMLGPDYKKDSVEWALWDSARKNLIQKTAPNTFAWLGYDEANSLLDALMSEPN